MSDSTRFVAAQALARIVLHVQSDRDRLALLADALRLVAATAPEEPRTP